MQWYYMVDGAQQGPVDDAAMLDLARRGVIHDDTLTNHEGSGGWEPWSGARAQLSPSQALPGPAPPAFVTPTFLVINVLVFVAMAVSGVSLMEPKIDDLLRWGADFGPLTMNGQWWRVVSSMFIHIGVIHLAMNMFVLWSAGQIIERLFGSVAFTVLYVLAGIGGSLTSLAWHPFIVSAGASGAVFGLFGGLLGFLVLARRFVPVETVKALGKYAGTFLAYNLVYGLAQSGIDMGAHLGGLVTGFLVGMALAAPAAAPGARLRRTAIVGVAGIACLAFVFTRLPARSVVVGKNDEVRYSAGATRKEAEALGRFLKQAGFFQDRGVSVELSRGADGASVSFAVKDGVWNDPGYLDGMNQLGPEIATAALGVPLAIQLVDTKGLPHRTIKITSKVVHVATNDRVYYEGSATEEEAKALGRALQTNGFFVDTGRPVTLSKGDGGTVVSLHVTAEAWGNPEYVKSAVAFGRQVAPAVGGVPITLRLVKPAGVRESVTGTKPETVDIPIR